MHMIFYRTLWLILSPFVLLWLLLRIIQKKEDFKRLPERFGISKTPRPNGMLVHFHCASVGESLSVLPLIEQLTMIDQDLHIMVTTGTRTSAKLMTEKLPSKAFHQYVPIDVHPIVNRFMHHWGPDLSIFVESEFWPELLHQSPHPVLLNARISDRSFKRYMKMGWFFKPLIHRFGACMGQTEQDAQRLSLLGGRRVSAPGNLKFDAPPLEVDRNELRGLHALLKERIVLVAASTHPGEDSLFLNLHQEMFKEHPSLITIIVPRHPHRGSEITKLAEASDLRVHQRSIGQRPDHLTEVYVADTIGEMGLWYELAQLVVIGGSFVEHGGQNPLEPLRIGKPTICGPHMFNFKQMMKQLDEKQIMHHAQNADELTEKARTLLKDPQPTPQTIQKRMAALAGGTSFALKTIITLLEGLNPTCQVHQNSGETKT